MDKNGCAPILGVVTFFAVWGACISTAGVMGFMLGWMAAGIVAVLATVLAEGMIPGVAAMFKDNGCMNLLLALASAGIIMLLSLYLSDS